MILSQDRSSLTVKLTVLYAHLHSAREAGLHQYKTVYGTVDLGGKIKLEEMCPHNPT